MSGGKIKRRRKTYQPCRRRVVCVGKFVLLCAVFCSGGLLLWQRLLRLLPRVRLELEADDDVNRDSARRSVAYGSSIAKYLPVGLYLEGPSCLELQARFNVQPMRSWGAMPPSVRPLWRQLLCNEALFQMAVPGARVEAQKAGARPIGHWGEHPPELVFDGHTETFFWSDGPVGTGDSIMVLLSPPVALAAVGVLTGEGGKDHCESCELQVSADGVSFATVAKLVHGAGSAAAMRTAAEAEAVGGAELRGSSAADTAAAQKVLQRVRAVRLLVTQPQTSWLKVREFTVTPRGTSREPPA